MSNNRKKKNRRTRAEPNQALKEAWKNFLLLSDDEKSTLACRGYVKLSDCPEVRMGIERIADLVSTMTIHLMQNTDDGDIRIKNELSRKIDINPYEYMTRQMWISWIVKSLLLNGNAIVLPTFNNGLIDNLVPISGNRVSFLETEIGYAVSVDGKIYKHNEVLHFRINPSENRPWLGESYKVTLSDVVQNLKQASHTTNEFMSNKVIPNLIVKVDALTDELANEEGRGRVYDKYLSASRAGEPWIIPAGLIDVQQVKPLTLNDIAIRDTIELSKSTVAGILGIPAFLLGIGSFNKDEYNNFVRTRIKVIAKSIEQTLTKDLLYSEDYYFKMNARSLYAYDTKELAEMYSDLATKGIVTGNEVRDAIGLSPLNGLNELKVLENYIPLDKIGDQKKLGGESSDGKTDEDN